MEWIVATIAICISMAALWLASTALGKAEEQITVFGNAVRKDVGGFKSDVSAQINEINKQLVLLDKRVDQTKTTEAGARKLIKDLRADLDKLEASVGELDSCIPPQFRRRPRGDDGRVNN